MTKCDRKKQQVNEGHFVSLNVGGQKFLVKKEHFEKSESPFFATLFEGPFKMEKDSEGNILIDRNPTYFQQVLDYVRESKLVFASVGEQKRFDEEMEFFGFEVDPIKSAKTKKMDSVWSILDPETKEGKMFLWKVPNEKVTGSTYFSSHFQLSEISFYLSTKRKDNNCYVLCLHLLKHPIKIKYSLYAFRSKQQNNNNNNLKRDLDELIEKGGQ